jgi:hypothetical protein
MSRVFLLRTLMWGGLAVAAYGFIHVLASGLKVPTVVKKATVARADSDNPREHPEPAEDKMPEVAGLSLHAINLWQRPRENMGKLVTLDPRSIPTLGPQNLITFERFARNFTVASGLIGLRYERNISPRICIFDVVAHPWTGFGTDHVPDAAVVGQIAVEMNSDGLIPDAFNLWDIEPKGTMDGTNQEGFVIRIPLIHFWRYHETKRDAEVPAVTTISPQPCSPRDIC